MVVSSLEGVDMTTGTAPRTLLDAEAIGAELGVSPRLAQRVMALGLLGSSPTGDGEPRSTADQLVAYVRAGSPHLHPPFDDMADFPDSRSDGWKAEQFRDAVWRELERQMPSDDQFRRMAEAKPRSESFDVVGQMTPRIVELARGEPRLARVPGEAVAPWGCIFGRQELRVAVQSSLQYSALAADPWAALYRSPQDFTRLFDRAYAEVSERRLMARRYYSAGPDRPTVPVYVLMPIREILALWPTDQWRTIAF
jgi:hypothetical protein